MVVIYHNNRCSKSRDTLQLIRESGITPKIINYLETPPDKAALKNILKKLSLEVRDIIRTNEDAYKAMNLRHEGLSEEELLQALIKHPKLLQRPIVIKDKQAVIGRPPENVLGIL